MKLYLLYTPIGKSETYALVGSRRYTAREIKQEFGQKVGDDVPVLLEDGRTVELLELTPIGDGPETRAMVGEIV